MTRFVRAFVCMAIFVLASGLLSACASFDGEGRAIRYYTYDAVDAMLSRARNDITKEMPILVSTVGNVDDVETSSTLGRAITEQVSARLSYKKYKVTELKLRQGISIREGGIVNPEASGEYMLSRDIRNISGAHKAALVVTGTYAVGARNVLVNLRLINIRTGEVVASSDYQMPKSADIVRMADPAQNGVTMFTGGGL